MLQNISVNDLNL